MFKRQNSKPTWRNGGVFLLRVMLLLWNVCTGSASVRLTLHKVTCSRSSPARSAFVSFNTCNFLIRSCLTGGEEWDTLTKRNHLNGSCFVVFILLFYPALISSVGCSIWARSSADRASCWVRRKWRAAPISSTVIIAGWVSRRGVNWRDRVTPRHPS